MIKLFLLFLSLCVAQNSTGTRILTTTTRDIVTTTTSQVIITTQAQTTTTTIPSQSTTTLSLIQETSTTTSSQDPQPTATTQTDSKSNEKLSTGLTVVIVIIAVCILAAGVGIYAFRTFGLKPSDQFKSRLRKQKSQDTVTRQDPNDVIHSASHSSVSPVDRGLSPIDHGLMVPVNHSGISLSRGNQGMSVVPVSVNEGTSSYGMAQYDDYTTSYDGYYEEGDADAGGVKVFKLGPRE